jgi:hypothetical protein
MHMPQIRSRFTAKVTGILSQNKRADNKDRERVTENQQKTMQHNNMTRVRTSPGVDGSPVRGGYFQESGALHGGTDFIQVEGEDVDEIMWAAADGKQYVDVSGNPCEIIGPKNEIMDFLGRVADRYWANGEKYRELRADAAARDQGTFDSAIWVEVVPFVPMSYERRYKVYNTNWMITKFGIQNAAAAAGAAGGAVNPMGNTTVGMAQTAGDTMGAHEEFQDDGGVGEIQSIEMEVPLYALVLSAVNQGGGVKLIPNVRIKVGRASPTGTMEIGDRDICVRTIEWYVNGDNRELLLRLGGTHDNNRRGDGWFKDKYDWTYWLARRLEEVRPGWIDGEISESGIVKGLDADLKEIISQVREQERRDKKYRIHNKTGKDLPHRTRKASVLDNADPYSLPAIRIADAVPEIEGMLK